MEVVIVKTDKELKDAFYVRQTVFVQEQNVPIEEEIDAYEEESVHFVLYDDDKNLLVLDVTGHLMNTER